MVRRIWLADWHGYWHGFWHGVICPIGVLASLFNDHVNIDEIHNNGNWYNVGFIL